MKMGNSHSIKLVSYLAASFVQNKTYPLFIQKYNFLRIGLRNKSVNEKDRAMHIKIKRKSRIELGVLFSDPFVGNIPKNISID